MKEKFFTKRNWVTCWSYKHEKCIKCEKTEHRHKGRWLCLSCWSKERKKNWKTPILIKISKKREQIRKRIATILRNTKRKRRILDKKIYQKIWRCEKISQKMLQKWKNPLRIILNWNLTFLPFENLDKPRLLGSKYINSKTEFKKNHKKYEVETRDYKRKLHILWLYKKYFNIYLKTKKWQNEEQKKVMS